jgi:hypothetical protein
MLDLYSAPRDPILIKEGLSSLANWEVFLGIFIKGYSMRPIAE